MNTSNQHAPTPSTYAEAAEILGTRDSRKIGHHTYLERLADDTIGVLFHRTYIVKFYSFTPAVRFDTGGWRTVTTRERMNRYLPAGFRVFNDRRVMYMGLPDGTREGFTDGWMVEGARLRRVRSEPLPQGVQ